MIKGIQGWSGDLPADARKCVLCSTVYYRAQWIDELEDIQRPDEGVKKAMLCFWQNIRSVDYRY